MNARQQNAALLAKIPQPPEGAVFSLRKVDTVILPHPFVIGKEHFGDGPYLKTDTVPCNLCKKPQSEHVAQKTLFVRVPQNRDLNAVPGLHEYLLSIKDKATELGIEGFAFPNKDPEKIRAWVKRGSNAGMGGFLEPPGHPNHFAELSYGKDGGAALSSVIEDEDGYYTDHLPQSVLNEVHQIFADYERTKPAIDHPRTLAWMQHAYQHLAHCYTDEKGEIEAEKYGKPETLIFPVPSYKLKHFHDDPRFSEEWRTKEQASIKQYNDELKAKYAKVCTPENHSAVRRIRKFYPEHQPRLDWILSPPKSAGNWYEMLEERPTPENCPGDQSVRLKHPVSGWCQFCGHSTEEVKKSA